MLLRVLDHYKDFHCIADKCKDSCCIGWEIDIDEDTYAYYRTVRGELGHRLKESMYETEEGDYSFRLKENGRCPFLNGQNLCDICAELGEEAFSEVCTEYPRFSVYYGNVLQKTLALSCEEAGRLVFTDPDPMKITDYEMPSEEDYPEEEWEEDPKVLALLEKAQEELLSRLQDRSKSLEDRLADAFSYGKSVQDRINGQASSEDAEAENLLKIDRTAALSRFAIFEEMETLDGEWETEKTKLRTFYGEAKDSHYEADLAAYLSGPDYREEDYEHLMVYFVFRYCMTAALDDNLLSKLRLALEFTLQLRDMAALRFSENGGRFPREDMIDIARIFSKEVEHSEENVAFAEEEFLFR